MKSNLSLLLLAAAIMGDSYGASVSNPYIDVTPKKPVIPKGCKEYFFNKNDGYCYQRNVYTVFSCIAMNPVKAKNKFDKWKLNNPQL